MSPGTRRNITRHELIGLQANVVKSPHPGHVGIKGKVVDETRNMLVISDGGKKKWVSKNVAVFHFTLPDGSVVEVDGRLIVGRPVSRVKKRGMMARCET